MADRPPAVAARTSRSPSPTGKNWRLWCPKLPAAPGSCGLRTAVSADSVTVVTLYGRRPFAFRAVLGPGRVRPTRVTDPAHRPRVCRQSPLVRASSLQQFAHLWLAVELHSELLENRSEGGHPLPHIVRRIPHVQDVEHVPGQPRGVASPTCGVPQSLFVDPLPSRLIRPPRIGVRGVHDVNRDGHRSLPVRPPKPFSPLLVGRALDVPRMAPPAARGSDRTRTSADAGGVVRSHEE